MTDETFIIRAYGKSELAMLYFPKHTPEAAMRLFRNWLNINPRLCRIISRSRKYYTPKQVRQIIEEVGEPFDIE